MSLTNTQDSYGAVTRTFHWVTALLILTVIPLGLIAADLAEGIAAPGAAPTDRALAWAGLLFTLHKTLGVTIFFVALGRILWAVTQPRPGLINGDNPAESLLAETVHWLLYGSLVAVPLSGWVHHAATTGFAPIWWPFGQDLPFVPKDAAWAKISGTLHFITQWVLIGAIALHIAGALKHHVIDRDATLRRMLPGGGTAMPSLRQPGHALPLLSALAVWGAAIGIGLGAGWFTLQERGTPPAAALAAAQGQWQVDTGSLTITVIQMGSEIAGTFADWTADIAYDEAADAGGRHGAVDVTVAIPSLTLGSVTDQAIGAEYLAAETYPTARFKADLVDSGAGLVADGTLTIRDRSVPVAIPAALQVEGDRAQASGTVSVDRRAFDVGTGVTDEGTLGFSVVIGFELTARRR